MSDWLHNLPIPWMALVIFGGVYLLALSTLACLRPRRSQHDANGATRRFAET
jgi:hypothetical protein